MPLPPHSAIPETGGAWTPRPCLAQTLEHKEYLDVFPNIGISNDFYWFTLEAAIEKGMHYRTKADTQKYRYATFWKAAATPTSCTAKTWTKSRSLTVTRLTFIPSRSIMTTIRAKRDHLPLWFSSGTALQAGTAVVTALIVCSVTLVAM